MSAVRIVELTREELLERRAEVSRMLGVYCSLPPRHQLQQELCDIDFLLSDAAQPEPRNPSNEGRSRD